MQILLQAFDATNRLSNRPAIVLAELRSVPQDISRLVTQMVDLLPEASGDMLQDGKPRELKEVLALLALRCLRGLGAEDMGVIRTDTSPGADVIGFECPSLEIGQDVMRTIVGALRILANQSGDVEEARAQIKQLQDKWQGALSHYAGRSAQRLGLPWTILCSGSLPLLAVGQGRRRQLFFKNFTPETAEAGVVFATQKHLSRDILSASGLPVPRQGVVLDVTAALQQAARIGWPVVVKPARTDFGIGITTGIRDEAVLVKGFEIARAHGPVLVQEHIDGDSHRLLVHDGEVISATRQKKAQVEGDGVHSVAQLIERMNLTRTDEMTIHWKKIKIDAGLKQTLANAGFTLESVPAKGEAVLLRSNTNISQGGTLDNITDEVHPANRAMAVMAAETLGLDLAGIDVQSKDITVPFTENGGAIIEVNPTPALFMGHMETEREDSVLRRFLPKPFEGRVPTILCLSDGPDLARGVAEALSDSHSGVALSLPDDITVAGQKLVSDGPTILHARNRIVMANPKTDLAVLSLTPQELSEHGLGLDRVDVVVVAEHLGPGGAEALALLAPIALKLVMRGSHRGVVDQVGIDGGKATFVEDDSAALAAIRDAISV
ncbi:MAG: hypothetical protein AAF641_01155 [Pseudomonadota bacterium]